MRTTDSPDAPKLFVSRTKLRLIGCVCVCVYLMNELDRFLLTHCLCFALQEICRETALMSDRQTHIGQNLKTLYGIGDCKFAHFMMARTVSIHFVDDNLRLIVWPLQCNAYAVNGLRISANDTDACGYAILGVDHFDPFDIGCLERTYRQQTHMSLLATQHHQNLLLNNVP